MAAVRAGREAGQWAGAARTVQRWLTHWREANPRLRPAKRHAYSGHLRLYLVPMLGRLRLDEVSPPVVQAAFDRIAAHRTAAGTVFSPMSVRRVHATLRAAFNAAIRDGLLSTNPARRTRLPCAQPARAEVWTPGRVAVWQATGEHPVVAVWTAEQLADFLAARKAMGDPLYPAWLLIGLRGLRRGEACGLRWCDLELDPPPGAGRRGWHGQLRVVQTLVHVGRDVVAAPPKTPSSRHTMSLDPATTKVLRRLRRTATRDAGGALDLRAPVFTDRRGQAVRPERLTGAFRDAVISTGLPPVRLHDLRHGAASLALAAGVDLKIVQDLLGHSTIITTADIYTSVLPPVHERCADAVADLLQAAARRRPHPQH